MSDEDILTGGETAPAPADIPAAPPSEEAVIRGRDIALGQLAKKEDVSDFVEERNVQELYFEQGKELNDQTDQRWFRRARKALQEAALEAQGIKLDEQGQPEAHWRVATRVITGFQTNPEASRYFGEPMAGGCGYAPQVACLLAKPLGHF